LLRRRSLSHAELWELSFNAFGEEVIADDAAVFI